ncbi:hypothetical protein FB33_0388 [Cutibacterium acnes]|nr:hypothetical protein FB33_0388 [Cutibacterium acnes]
MIIVADRTGTVTKAAKQTRLH